MGASIVNFEHNKPQLEMQLGLVVKPPLPLTLRLLAGQLLFLNFSLKKKRKKKAPTKFSSSHIFALFI